MTNKSNQLVTIEKELTSPAVTNKLIVALDLRPEDEAAQREAYKFASSVLAEVKRSEGDDYGDLTKCTPDSIVMAMIDAATYKVAIDGRKLAHLEKRGNKAILQIDTNGFVAKIKERYPDFEHTVTAVFQGDERSISGKDGKKTYTHTTKDPFAGPDKLEGFLVWISYTNHGGEKVSDVHTVSKAEMLVIQSKGKGTAWKTFPLERMKTAALKRACKWHFRQDATLQKMVDYDNQNNFDLQAATPVRKTIVDNINENVTAASAPQAAPANETTAPEIPDVEFEDVPPEQNPPQTNDAADLKKAGDEAAGKGVDAYKAWKDALTDEQKVLVAEHHRSWWETAKEVSRKSTPNDEPPM